MAARIDPARWYWSLAVATLAALVGLLAGRDPKLAIAASIGLCFLLLTLADLVVGVTIFTAASFLELASGASGVGIAKVLGLALAISWIATIAAGRAHGRFVWLSSPGLSVMILALLAWGMLSLLWAESTSLALAQMFRYGLVALLVPIVFTAVRSGSALKAVTGAFVAGATLAAAYGLFAPPDASGVQGSVDATEQLNRIAGTVGDPNVFASVLLVGAILAVSLAFTQRGSPALQTVLVGCAVICVAGVVLTFSRGGLLSLGVAILAAPIVARHKGATLAAGGLLLVCVVAYIGVLGAGRRPRPDRRQRRRQRPHRHLEDRLENGRGQAGGGNRGRQLPDLVDPLPDQPRGGAGEDRPGGQPQRRPQLLPGDVGGTGAWSGWRCSSGSCSRRSGQRSGRTGDSSATDGRTSP